MTTTRLAVMSMRAARLAVEIAAGVDGAGHEHGSVRGRQRDRLARAAETGRAQRAVHVDVAVRRDLSDGVAAAEDDDAGDADRSVGGHVGRQRIRADRDPPAGALRDRGGQRGVERRRAADADLIAPPALPRPRRVAARPPSTVSMGEASSVHPARDRSSRRCRRSTRCRWRPERAADHRRRRCPHRGAVVAAARKLSRCRHHHDTPRHLDQRSHAFASPKSPKLKVRQRRSKMNACRGVRPDARRARAVGPYRLRARGACVTKSTRMGRAGWPATG